jgi:hypothetical protein
MQGETAYIFNTRKSGAIAISWHSTIRHFRRLQKLKVALYISNLARPAKALLDFSTASPIARWHDRWDGLLCINILIVLVCLQIGAVDSYYGWIGGGIDTLRWNGARGSIKHVYHFLVVLHKHPYPLHPHL